MEKITSKDNIRIKDLVRFRDDSKFRNDKSLFYVEGERIINDTPINLIDSIYITEDKFDDYKNIVNKIDSDKVYIVSDEVFNKIKDTVNSQGIIALVKYNLILDIKTIDLNKTNTCLILDNINDPGNLGTIIRVSEAANIGLVILANNCCNVYNPKVIRSCMSSVFRQNIYVSENIINDISFLKSIGFNIYATSLSKESKAFNSINYTKTCIILGNEANGVKKELQDIADNKIYIPMHGSIESLNVAVATSIIIYEIMRQNNYYGICSK